MLMNELIQSGIRGLEETSIGKYRAVYDSLTDNQKAIYNMEMDSSMAEISVPNKAQMIGITPRAYYNFLNHEKFQYLKSYNTANELRVNAYDILGAALDNAINGGKDGVQDRKLLIGMLKDLTAKQEKPPIIFVDDFKGTTNAMYVQTPTIQEYFNVTDEELENMKAINKKIKDGD